MELKCASFEQAKALAELGFPQSEYGPHYKENGEPENGLTDLGEGIYFVPTLELVAKWLRNEKKINVQVVEYINEDRPVDISYIINIYFDRNDGYRHATYIDTPLDDLMQKYSYESKNWSDEQLDFYYNEMENHKYFIDYEEALSFGIDKAIEILKSE